MKPEVDLSPLAIDRTERRPSADWRVLGRYAAVAILLVGTSALIGWAAYDLVFPPRDVTVVPVLASRAELQREGTPLFEAAGWIEPRPMSIRVAALAPGVVEELLVVEDQAVEAGEPIAELIRRDASLAHERAQAELELREAELRAATTHFDRPVHLEAAVGEAEAELAAVEMQSVNLPFEIRRAEAGQGYAKRNYEGKASAGDAVSQRIIDQAKSEYESARALVEELNERVDSLGRQKTALTRRRDALQQQLDLRTDELRAKEEAAARVRLAEVALDEAELQLERMTVRSPIDGRVLQLIAQPGSRLMIGRGGNESYDASTVVTLYRPRLLQVRVDVRFEDLPRVRLGQGVVLASPAVASPISGTVLLIGSEADTQKNTLEIKVAIDSPPAVLKPQMLVDVTFLAPKLPDADASATGDLRLFVPENLVVRDSAGSYVWVADQAAGVARRMPVELGVAAADGLVEVKTGLNAASRLIASSRDDLRDGERIRVTGEAPESAATSKKPSSDRSR